MKAKTPESKTMVSKLFLSQNQKLKLNLCHPGSHLVFCIQTNPFSRTNLHFHRGANQITFIHLCTKIIFISKRLRINQIKWKRLKTFWFKIENLWWFVMHDFDIWNGPYLWQPITKNSFENYFNNRCSINRLTIWIRKYHVISFNLIWLCGCY